MKIPHHIAMTYMENGTPTVHMELLRKPVPDDRVFPDNLRLHRENVLKQILNITYRQAKLGPFAIARMYAGTSAMTAELVCGAMLFREVMDDIHKRMISKSYLTVTFNKSFDPKAGVLYYNSEDLTPEEIMANMKIFYMKD